RRLVRLVHLLHLERVKPNAAAPALAGIDGDRTGFEWLQKVIARGTIHGRCDSREPVRKPTDSEGSQPFPPLLILLLILILISIILVRRFRRTRAGKIRSSLGLRAGAGFRTRTAPCSPDQPASSAGGGAV